jgi:hypothetical protein
VTDWFERAAPLVLELDNKELVLLAIPVARTVSAPEEQTIGSLALLELARRKAVADPERDAEHQRRGCGSYRSLLEHVAERDADGFGKRIAALVRKRPQPRKVKLRPWVPPWKREPKP